MEKIKIYEVSEDGIDSFSVVEHDAFISKSPFSGDAIYFIELNGTEFALDSNELKNSEMYLTFDEANTRKIEQMTSDSRQIELCKKFLDDLEINGFDNPFIDIGENIIIDRVNKLINEITDPIVKFYLSKNIRNYLNDYNVLSEIVKYKKGSN